MMILKKIDNTSVEVDEKVYQVILKVLQENDVIKCAWLPYTGIFPVIKSDVQKELGAAVWYVAPVLEHLSLTTNAVLIRDDLDGIEYYIENSL